MKDIVPVPSKGTPLRASWGAAVANGLNALMAMSSPGLLTREGVTGTGAEPFPQNRRTRSGAVYADNSCFRFGTVEVEVEDAETHETTTEAHPAIVCCYYNVGGITRHMDDFDVSAILPPAPGEGEEPATTFLCFKLTGSSPSIVAIEEDDLEAEQRDADNYVVPLYRYYGATLTDDLRNAIGVQMFEGGLT